MKGFRDKNGSPTNKKRDTHDHIVQFSDYTAPRSNGRTNGPYREIAKTLTSWMMLMCGSLAVMAVRAMLRSRH